jgi:hypothetical protein
VRLFVSPIEEKLLWHRQEYVKATGVTALHVGRALFLQSPRLLRRLVFSAMTFHPERRAGEVRGQRKGGRQGGAIFILGLMSFNRIDRGFFLPSNEGVMRKLANRLKTRKRGALPAFWL